MSIADEPLSHREWCIAFVHGFMGVANMDFEGYDVQPKVGDLVLLRSAPPSLWSISYIVDYRPIIHDGREIIRTCCATRGRRGATQSRATSHG